MSAQWPRRAPPRKVRYFEPVLPRLGRNTIIESTFEVGRRYRCTMRVDCGCLDPGTVICPEPGEWQPRMPERLEEEDLADWRGRLRRDLSARRPDGRRPAYGRRRLSGSNENPGGGAGVFMDRRSSRGKRRSPDIELTVPDIELTVPDIELTVPDIELTV